jgi:hypothetical protein
MSLIFATQLTAIATMALAVFAIVTASFALLAYRAQSQEVGILLEQSKREALERHRAQAARVFTGIPPVQGQPVIPYAVNASDFPIYDAQLWYLDDRGHSYADLREDIGMISPGDNVVVSTSFQSKDVALTHTVFTFRDAAGVRWMRLPEGALEEQSGATAADSVLAMFGDPSADPQNR